MNWGISKSFGLIFLCAFIFSPLNASPRPEVMLLIDSSGGAQRHFDEASNSFVNAVCASSASGAANGQHALSMHNQIQNVLTGEPLLPSAEVEQRCIFDVLHLSQPNYLAAKDVRALNLEMVNRYLHLTDEGQMVATSTKGMLTVERACCSRVGGDRCGTWTICDGIDDEDQYAGSGLIHNFRRKIKFGLMTTDADPKVEGSYGSEQEQPAFSVGGQLTQNPLIAGLYSSFSGEPVPNQPNLGATAREGGLLRLNQGSTILPHHGRFADGRINDAVKVGELASELQPHNDYVIHRLRTLRPSGFGALAAELRDYQEYIENSEKGVTKDQQGLCRKRAVVILTHADAVMNTYAAANCFPDSETTNNNGCPPQETHPYRGVLEQLTALSLLENVEIHYLSFGLSAAQKGQIDDRLGTRGRAYSVANEQDLRRILAQVFGALSTDKSSNRPPLVVTPYATDGLPQEVKQFRLTGYSEPSAGGSYGRISVSAFGCGQGGGQDPLGRLRPLAAQSYDVEDKLALQSEVVSFASHPVDEGTFGLVETTEASIVSPGEFAIQPRILEDALRSLLKLSEAEVFRDVFRMLEGYFGPAVSPDVNEACRPLCGLPADQPQRQLGAIQFGQFSVVAPPQLDLPGEGFQAFELEQRARPTLFVSGAGDGKVHFFRIADGREVFSFVPAIAMGDLRNGVAVPNEGGLRVDGHVVARSMIMCRSLLEGATTCPSNPEDFQVRSLVVGSVGAGGGNIYGVDISSLNEVLDFDNNDPVSVDEVTSWDILRGYSNPNHAGQAAWNTEEGQLQ